MAKTNPDRYDYDDDKYYYDEYYDRVRSRDDSDEQYDGDGNRIEPDSGY